jgi:hypothetical protein
MNALNDRDHQFHENLLGFGERITTPLGPSTGVRARCVEILNRNAKKESPMTRAYRLAKRPAFISSLGVAASLALIVGFLYLPRGDARVKAAVILERLQTQIQESPVLDIKIEALNVENASVAGRLQVSPHGVGGDIQARVTEDGETTEADLSLGIGPDDSWILIRKLVVPDPKATALLRLFITPGRATLIKLPAEELGLDLGDLGNGFQGINGIQELGEFVRHLIDAQGDVKATVVDQPDDTVLLTLPLDDVETIRMLAEVGAVSKDLSDEERQKLADVTAQIELSEEDMAKLQGMTLSVVYDPSAELVRSIVVDGIGETNGRVSISLRQGDIDPGLLDSSRVTDENTRILDLAALAKAFESFGADSEAGSDSDD